MAWDLNLQLKASGPITATENGNDVNTEGGGFAEFRAFYGTITGTNPTCDLEIHASTDGGTVYRKIGVMPQVVGDDDDKQVAIMVYVPKPDSGQTVTKLRYRAVIGGSNTPTFPFSVEGRGVPTVAPYAPDEDLQEGFAFPGADVA